MVPTPTTSTLYEAAHNCRGDDNHRWDGDEKANRWDGDEKATGCPELQAPLLAIIHPKVGPAGFEPATNRYWVSIRLVHKP